VHVWFTQIVTKQVMCTSAILTRNPSCHHQALLRLPEAIEPRFNGLMALINQEWPTKISHGDMAGHDRNVGTAHDTVCSLVARDQ